MGLFDKLTQDERLALEGKLFSGLTKTKDDAVWDDAADIITFDIRVPEIEARKQQGQ